MEPAATSPPPAEGVPAAWKPVPEPEPEPEGAVGDDPGVHWRVYLRSRWGVLLALVATFSDFKRWVATKEGAGTSAGLAIFVVQHLLGQHLFAFAIDIVRMAMLWLPFIVLMLLMAPLPTPVLPFPYLVIWRGASSWLDLPLLSLIVLGLVVGISSRLPEHFGAQGRLEKLQDWSAV